MSGGGKSTFLDLLMGLLAPTTGVIRVDGVDVDDKSRTSWQKIISHVPQHVFLVHGTIAENIALGTPLDKIDTVRLEDAIRQSQLSDVIMNLDKGIYSDIGENGAKLSGGQRQRIGIARALYQKAQILIMDEATSALDSVTESNILNSIYELDKEKTIFIVTHRLSTLNKCDFLVEIKDGEINIKSKNYRGSKDEIWSA
jgi:ABC-type multidrug transport system fused ATPase/permease subunit